LQVSVTNRKENIATIFGMIDLDKSGDIVASEMAKFAKAVKADSSLNKLMVLTTDNARLLTLRLHVCRQWPT
jgi:Ca2+-binding EF-hand superfamily protein